MLNRVLTEVVKIEVSWRLAFAGLVGAATVAAATVTWANDFGDKVLKQAREDTVTLLKTYVPYSVWSDKWEVKLQQDQERHQEIIERLIRLETAIKGRSHGRN